MKVEKQDVVSGNSTIKRLVSNVVNGKVIFTIEVREPSDTKWWKWGMDLHSINAALTAYDNVMQAPQ